MGGDKDPINESGLNNRFRTLRSRWMTWKVDCPVVRDSNSFVWEGRSMLFEIDLTCWSGVCRMTLHRWGPGSLIDIWLVYCRAWGVCSWMDPIVYTTTLEQRCDHLGHQAHRAGGADNVVEYVRKPGSFRKIKQTWLAGLEQSRLRQEALYKWDKQHIPWAKQAEARSQEERIQD